MATATYAPGIPLREDLDDFDLPPHDFRVYAHIATYATATSPYVESVGLIASVCRMGQSRVRRALRTLERRGLIRCEPQTGAENAYWLTPGGSA